MAASTQSISCQPINTFKVGDTLALCKRGGLYEIGKIVEKTTNGSVLFQATGGVRLKLEKTTHATRVISLHDTEFSGVPCSKVHTAFLRHCT